ncbi:MAG TPA: hypothetical protein VGC01_10655, partial [Mucilaginibacter sp.]
MKKNTLLLSLIGLVTSAYAQQNPTAMKYAQIINADLAKKHLSIIASDAFEGRETGKPGADKAAHYIADEFKSLGLQPIVNGAYFLDIPVVESTFKVNLFTVNGTSFTSGKDFTATGGTDSKTINASDIVFIGYGIGADNYDDLKGIDITGKVVVYISNGEPMVNGKSKITGTDQLSDWSAPRSNKRIQYIQSKKPALILAVNTAAGNRRGGGGGGRMSIKKDGTATANTQAVVYTISPEIADQLLKNSGKTFALVKGAIDQAGMPQSQTVKADISTSYATEETPVKAVDVLGFLP